MKTKIFLFAGLFFTFSVAVFAQKISGKYEGFADVQPFGKLPISAEIREKNAALTGVFNTPLGAAQIIGGLPIEEIFRRSQEYISQNETPQFVSEASANFLTFPAFLKQIGAARSNDKANFEFIDEKSKKFPLELSAGSPDKTVWIYPYKTAPLWLENQEKPLAYKFLPTAKIVYVRFQSYPRRKEFRNFSDELFAFLDKTQPEKIVFDLRSNGGGDFTRGRDFFIKQLKARPNLTKKGKLFVITGRRTFSAGMSNAADFRNEFGAILVGEPTGQKPNGYSENRYFKLPNSHFDFSVSIDFYKFAETDTSGLLPDKLIEPDWQSFKQGRDPAMEWILASPVIK